MSRGHVSIVVIALALPGCNAEDEHRGVPDLGTVLLDSIPLTTAPGQTTGCKQSSDCVEGSLCAPDGSCQKDCRVSKQCPATAPRCDQSTGLCFGAGDGGLPALRPDAAGGAKPTCKLTSDCPKEGVCAPNGQCVPDCRVKNQCPPGIPTCDSKTGLCMAGPGAPGGDGGLPAPPTCKQTSECGKDQVCATQVGLCVPDCRLGKPCPSQHPTCNTTTGVCM